MKDKIYFKNLNSIRFIAAFLVIIHHLEQIKSLSSLPNYWSNPFILIIGKLGVVLFFVLSGFLITFLLMVEEKQTKTISIKNFYLRRILRIWPLYYLIVFLGLLFLPSFIFFEWPVLTAGVFTGFYRKISLFLFFLPNIALILYPAVPYLSQSWSVGVEEQFYLIWPVVMKRFKNKGRILIAIISIYLIISFGLQIAHKFSVSPLISVLNSFWAGFSIDCMALGGIFAFLLFKKSKIIFILFDKKLQILNIVLLIILIGFGINIPYLHNEFYAILFGTFIVNMAANPRAIFNLENSIFKYLGKISYGLYMFHPLGIFIALKFLGAIDHQYYIYQLLTSLILTILISAFSYHFYEVWFIHKKIKYSKVISGDNVHFKLKNDSI